jgi:type IV secretory pathway VirB10-like protein
VSADPNVDIAEEGGIKDEIGASSRLNAAKEDAATRSTLVEAIDRRWIFMGVPGVVLGLFLLSSLGGGGDTAPPTAAPPPVVETPESAEPPYAIGRAPFDSSSSREGAWDTLGGAPPIPPPSSAVVGPGDYRAVRSGDPPGSGPQQPVMQGGDAQGSPAPPDPRREAFVEALNAPPVADAPASAPSPLVPELQPLLNDSSAPGLDEGSDVRTLPVAGAGGARRPLPRGLVVPALTVISAALVTMVNSDNSGDIIAQISRDVTDATGRTVAIPRGSLLYGRQSDQVAVGQQRLAVAWTLLQLSDRTLVELPGLPMLDETGASGVRGQGSSHLPRTLGNVMLVSTLTAAVGASQPTPRDGERPSLAQAGSATVSQELARLGTELMRRDLAARPTIRLPRGQPVRVILRDHLVISPR